MVPVARLYGFRPKVEETLVDLREGRLSMTEGPVQVSKLDSVRGGWFVMDGHHRALEAIAAGAGEVSCEVSEHVPYFERPVGPTEGIVGDMVRLFDAAGGEALGGEGVPGGA